MLHLFPESSGVVHLNGMFVQVSGKVELLSHLHKGISHQKLRFQQTNLVFLQASVMLTKLEVVLVQISIVIVDHLVQESVEC